MHFPSPKRITIAFSLTLTGTMPVFKLSTTRDRAPAPAGALPLYDGQQLDLQDLSLKVLKLQRSFGLLLLLNSPASGHAHSWPHQRQHLPVACIFAHASLCRHAVGLGINHGGGSRGLYEIIGCASSARSAAARAASRARPTHRASAAAAAGRDTAATHRTIHRPSQLKDFTSWSLPVHARLDIILPYCALPTLLSLQVLAAVQKLAAQGCGPAELNTRRVTQEVRRQFHTAERSSVLSQCHSGLP